MRRIRIGDRVRYVGDHWGKWESRLGTVVTIYPGYDDDGLTEYPRDWSVGVEVDAIPTLWPYGHKDGTGRTFAPSVDEVERTGE